MLFPMVHDKGGLGGSICMYSVISKTTVLFVREVRALGIFGPSVAPRHRAKKCVIFSRANIFRVRIFFATSKVLSLLLSLDQTNNLQWQNIPTTF
jgi:hypothetical protein